MNYKWNFVEPTSEQETQAQELAKGLNISPILGRLLVNRGITDVWEARRFFHPQLNELLDPFLFRDMDKAVDRLNRALAQKERIMVYGDYDVDGCTAVALVYKFLEQYYSNLDYYIPDRYEEGYGVSVQGVDYAYDTGVKLVIVLDCGIKAVETIAYAKEKGIGPFSMPNVRMRHTPTPTCRAVAWDSSSCKPLRKATALSSPNSYPCSICVQ